MKLRLRERLQLGACGAALYASGALLWVCARWFRVPGPFGEQPNPWVYPLRIAHTATGWWALLAAGYLFKAHILPGWRAKRRRASGTLVCTLLAALTLSGLGLLYGGEAWGEARAAAAHTGVGLGAVVPLLWHAQKRHRQRRPACLS